MKIKVNPHTVEIVKEQTKPINEQEIKISKCEFEFDEEITSDYVKEAYFTLNGSTYKMIIENNECDYPSEVLTQNGVLEIGVVAYLVENEQEIKRYNPSPDYFETWVGSLKDAENSEPITPSDKEQMEQMLQDGLEDIEEAIERASTLDIEESKTGKITTITITKQDGTTEEVQLEDGKSIEYNWVGTSLGIRQEGETDYVYVDLKGEQGPAGSIRLLIVNVLPITGEDGVLYFVPKEEPEQQDRYYEYTWLNNDWELLGEKQITIDLSDYYTKQEVNSLIPTTLSQLTDDSTHRTVTDVEKTTWNDKIDESDLTDYVKNTNYATTTVGGVIKANDYYNYVISTSSGALYTRAKTYQEYANLDANAFIGKGTLENVIAGKDLTTKSYVDGLVGDIESILETLDTGSGV